MSRRGAALQRFRFGPGVLLRLYSRRLALEALRVAKENRIY